jgi:hypothetical protein
MDLGHGKINWLIVSHKKVFDKERLCQLALLAANNQTTALKVESTETGEKDI